MSTITIAANANATAADHPTSRLVAIAERQRRSRFRQRVFIAAVGLITLLTAGSIALATTADLVPSASAAPTRAAPAAESMPSPS